MISNFHSVVVQLVDLERGVADYSRLLGQIPDPVEIESSSGTRSVLFPLAKLRLETRAGSGVDVPSPPGLSRICFECDDIASFAAALEGDGSGLLSSEKRQALLEDAEDGSDPLRHWLSTRVDPVVSRAIGIELISDETGSTKEHEPASEDQGIDESLDPASLIRGLDHVVVMSSDIEATRDFYADGLGLRLALDRRFEKRGVRLLFFRIMGITIEIGGRLAASPNPTDQDRFGGLAWQVVDIDAIHSRLSSEGFEISGIRDGHKPGTRVCTVRDPVHEVPTLLIEPVS
jgi:catechol 2,3-dioxygenase-like lactoylglutathione lyase family enzyme